MVSAYAEDTTCPSLKRQAAPTAVIVTRIAIAAATARWRNGSTWPPGRSYLDLSRPSVCPQDSRGGVRILGRMIGTSTTDHGHDNDNDNDGCSYGNGRPTVSAESRLHQHSAMYPIHDLALGSFSSLSDCRRTKAEPPDGESESHAFSVQSRG